MNFNTLDVQEGKLGKSFRQVCATRNGQMPEKWINGSYKFHTIYEFVYIEDEKRFSVETDYNGKIIKVKKDI